MLLHPRDVDAGLLSPRTGGEIEGMLLPEGSASRLPSRLAFQLGEADAAKNDVFAVSYLSLYYFPPIPSPLPPPLSPSPPPVSCLIISHPLEEQEEEETK